MRVFMYWTGTDTSVTFTGPAVIARDSANNNRAYGWVVVPANSASFVATTASANPGGLSAFYSDAVISGCSTSSGVPMGITNDFCYNIQFEASTVKYKIEITLTQFSPISYLFELSPTNCVLQMPAGTNVGSNSFTFLVQGRPPPSSSPVPTRLVGYIAGTGSGINSWYSFSFNHFYVYGDAAAVHDSSYRYSIPWIGSRTISQGNGGTLSHRAGTADHYAIDVPMAIGTPLFAARPGYVSFVEESNTQSSYQACPSNPTTCNVVGAQDNYVTVIHSGMELTTGTESVNRSHIGCAFF